MYCFKPYALAAVFFLNKTTVVAIIKARSRSMNAKVGMGQNSGQASSRPQRGTGGTYEPARPGTHPRGPKRSLPKGKKDAVHLVKFNIVF